jgi:hypothetical protein
MRHSSKHKKCGTHHNDMRHNEAQRHLMNMLIVIKLTVICAEFFN